MCVVGALRGQPDASAEVHQSLEESSAAATLRPAGLHEDAGEGRTPAHVQAQGRLDRLVQVTSLCFIIVNLSSFLFDGFVNSKNVQPQCSGRVLLHQTGR